MCLWRSAGNRDMTPELHSALMEVFGSGHLGAPRFELGQTSLVTLNRSLFSPPSPHHRQPENYTAEAMWSKKKRGRYGTSSSSNART